MFVPVVSALLLIIGFFSFGLRAPLAALVGVLAFLAAILNLVLTSFFPPGARWKALLVLQNPFSDPRRVFATAAQSGEKGFLVSYTRYRTVHHLFLLIGGALVVISLLLILQLVRLVVF